MEIAPFVTRAVLAVDAEESLRAAAVSMMERGVGSAVVLADDRPTGVFTDREALRALAQGKSATRCTVGQVATGRLTTVNPSLELLEAAKLMRERGFRHLVVVDDDGRLVGVFSMRDLVVGLLEERSALASSANGAES
jgi:CBS domain-containing protein